MLLQRQKNRHTGMDAGMTELAEFSSFGLNLAVKKDVCDFVTV
jgi:hypothetical protein